MDAPPAASASKGQTVTAAANVAIGAESLVREFTGIRAVAGIDLAVERGQVFGFLGANGSGKTTTIRMLTTPLRPTAGRAYVDGLDVQRDPTEVRRRIGVALQEAGLDDLQTGRELLTLQGRLHGVPRSRIAARAAELLAIVDLEDAADRRIGTYSGGMQRRLDLASALVHRPGIVFLDEPTSGLDPISRDALWRYVEQLNREDGVTFFLTTQYLEEADRLADEVAIIDAGRIVAQGSPANLKATIGADVVTMHVDANDGSTAIARAVLRIEELDGLEEVRTLDDAIVVYIADGSRAIARLVTLAQESGLSVREVTLAQPTLDDVFLRATGRHLEVDGTRGVSPRSGTRGVSPRAGGGERMTALVVGTYELAWRAVRETIRQPGVEVGNLFIPLFFFFVTVGAISNIAGPALGIENYEGFQLPVAVTQGVAGAAAISGVAIVKDIESGYFDKLLLTPMPRLAIVLGRLVADGIRCAAFHVDHHRGARLFQRGVGGGAARLRRDHSARGAVRGGVLRDRGGDRAAHGERAGRAGGVPDLLPAAVPLARVRAEGDLRPVDGVPRLDQPGHLPARRHADAGARWLGVGQPRRRVRLGVRARRRYHRARPVGAAHEDGMTR